MKYYFAKIGLKTTIASKKFFKKGSSFLSRQMKLF
jgi:hypothetical protein